MPLKQRGRLQVRMSCSTYSRATIPRRTRDNWFHYVTSVYRDGRRETEFIEASSALPRGFPQYIPPSLPYSTSTSPRLQHHNTPPISTSPINQTSFTNHALIQNSNSFINREHLRPQFETLVIPRHQIPRVSFLPPSNVSPKEKDDTQTGDGCQ